MSPLTLSFYGFLAVALGAFYLCPPRWRVTVLAASNLAFFALVGTSDLGWFVAVVVTAFAAGSLGTRWPWVPSAGAITLVVVLLGIKVFDGGLNGTENAAFVGSSTLPFGISYYTLPAIGYLVELRRRSDKPRGFAEVNAGVGLFPHVQAGPVLEPRRIFRQIDSGLKVRADNLSYSTELMLSGLFKELAVAIPMRSSAIDTLQGTDGGVTAVAALMVLGISIYFDIWGFTDSARGAIGLFGIRVPINFNRPLTRSTSLTDFWQRWQISIVGWFRSYIYRPVSRLGIPRAQAVGIIATFGGLAVWHGISVWFLAWGLLNAFALLIERSFFARSIGPGTSATRSRRSLLLGRLWVYAFHLVAMPIMLSDDPTFRTVITRARSVGADGFTQIAVPLMWSVLWLILLDRRADRREDAMRNESRHSVQLTDVLMFAAMAFFAVFLSASTDTQFIYEGF